MTFLPTSSNSTGIVLLANNYGEDIVRGSFIPFNITTTSPGPAWRAEAPLSEKSGDNLPVIQDINCGPVFCVSTTFSSAIFLHEFKVDEAS